MKPMSVPTITSVKMQAVDWLMLESYHIDLLQMMENAGRSLAGLARRLLDNDILDRPVVVLAGRGNNGGGGMAAARHLLNWGADVQVLCSHALDGYNGAPAHQLRSLQAMAAPLAWADEGWELPPCDLVVDAVIGYGLQGDPRGTARNLIQLANSSVAPILSLDVPSGLDATAGTVWSPCVQATATLTLALPKTGLIAPQAQAMCGELYLADIGVPQALYSEIGLDELPPFFAHAPIVRLQIEAETVWAHVDAENADTF